MISSSNLFLILFNYLKCIVEMKVGEAYEDGSRSDALTFGMGTDGGYVLKNTHVSFKSFFI